MFNRVSFLTFFLPLKYAYIYNYGYIDGHMYANPTSKTVRCPKKHITLGKIANAALSGYQVCDDYEFIFII